MKLDLNGTNVSTVLDDTDGVSGLGGGGVFGGVSSTAQSAFRPIREDSPVDVADVETSAEDYSSVSNVGSPSSRTKAGTKILVKSEVSPPHKINICKTFFKNLNLCL